MEIASAVTPPSFMNSMSDVMGNGQDTNSNTGNGANPITNGNGNGGSKQVNVSKPKGPRGSYDQYSDNERNVAITMCGVIMLLALALVLPMLLKAPSVSYICLFSALAACATAMQGTLSYVRNLKALDENEHEYIDWKQSSYVYICLGVFLLLVSGFVLFELYSQMRPQRESASDTKSQVKAESIDSSALIGSEVAAESIDSAA